MTEPSISRRRTTYILLVAGTVLGLGFLALAGTAWWIASQPANGSARLVTRANLFAGVFQALLGLSVALSTIYYAGRTSEMVDAMHVATRTSSQETVRRAVERLTEAAIAAIVDCGVVARLMKKDWRWYLPMRSAARTTFLQQELSALTTEVTEVVKASESLRTAFPLPRHCCYRIGDGGRAGFRGSHQRTLRRP